MAKEKGKLFFQTIDHFFLKDFLFCFRKIESRRRKKLNVRLLNADDKKQRRTISVI